mgnify:CR=1 FL=1
MDTQKLRTFVTVAATLNYTEAAARLYTTQATVSKQILALEKQWQVTLFSRAHRQVQLTAAGQALLPKAQAVVTAANALQAAAAAVQTGAGSRLRIKTIPSIANYRAFNQIAAFHRTHPEIRLQLTEGETDAVAEALTAGEADIIFTRLFDQPDAATESVIGESDALQVLVPKTSPLARRQALTVQDLANEDLLLLGESTYLMQPVRRLFAAQGLTPHLTYQGQRIDLILGVVSRGLGISIVMQKAVALTDYPALTLVPLTPTVTSHLAFVRRHGHHHPASDAFWAFIQRG